MDWLVDTNILIDHLRGVPKATTFLRQAGSAGTLWLSAITVAEVYAGQVSRKGCSGSVWLGERGREGTGPYPLALRRLRSTPGCVDPRQSGASIIHGLANRHSVVEVTDSLLSEGVAKWLNSAAVKCLCRTG